MLHPTLHWHHGRTHGATEMLWTEHFTSKTWSLPLLCEVVLFSTANREFKQLFTHRAISASSPTQAPPIKGRRNCDHLSPRPHMVSGMFFSSSKKTWKLLMDWNQNIHHQQHGDLWRAKLTFLKPTHKVPNIKPIGTNKQGLLGS